VWGGALGEARDGDARQRATSTEAAPSPHRKIFAVEN
jgi:hypothetical protein